MIIIGLRGGLGNQMFQYALFCKLESLGIDAYIDRSYYEMGMEKRRYELDVFPNVQYKVSTEAMNVKLRGEFKSFIEKVRRKFKLRKEYFRERVPGYYPQIYTWDNMYLDGYWQSEKYFKDIKEDILSKFEFPELQGEKNIEVAEKIKNTNAVSVHIRRGDFLKNKSKYGNIWEDGYYKKAIECVENQLENPVFYFFSDDMEWVRGNYKGSNFVYVDNKNSGETGYVDMQLMSMCKHNIIANSSYSWWAAWLNQNDKKIVIAPSFWDNDMVTNDVYCDGWKVV